MNFLPIILRHKRLLTNKQASGIIHHLNYEIWKVRKVKVVSGESWWWVMIILVIMSTAEWHWQWWWWWSSHLIWLYSNITNTVLRQKTIFTFDTKQSQLIRILMLSKSSRCHQNRSIFYVMFLSQVTLNRSLVFSPCLTDMWCQDLEDPKHPKNAFKISQW